MARRRIAWDGVHEIVREVGNYALTGCRSKMRSILSSPTKRLSGATENVILYQPAVGLWYAVPGACDGLPMPC